MKVIQQSPLLKAAFQKQVDTKKSAKHQEIHDALGDSVFANNPDTCSSFIL